MTAQLQVLLHRRGGKRRNAGRKPKGDSAGVPHRPRPALASRYPVHVTLRVHDDVASLRSRQCFRGIVRSFQLVGRRHRPFRLAEFSVQGNHLHLIVEAADAAHLGRGMQGLAISIAKRLNVLLTRRGAVFTDRYHAHILRTPTEVANALAYVRGNLVVHAQRRGEPIPASYIDPCSSAALVDGALSQGPPLVAPPTTWLLSVGWTRARLRRRD
jgi:REP element-mobilizing transposase RayT